MKPCSVHVIYSVGCHCSLGSVYFRRPVGFRTVRFGPTLNVSAV